MAQPTQPATNPDPVQAQPDVQQPVAEAPQQPAPQTPPAAPQATPEPAPAAPMAAPEKSEALEDQNIFVMLGVHDGSDEEKEAFLDELQQVIWEDFLEYDVKLLVTSDELAEMQKLMAGTYANDLEKQEKIILFLEKLIPDLEDIMLEKALELKADMFFERLAGLREFFAGNAENLQKLDAAEALAKEDKWLTASESLNALPVGS